MERIFSSSFWLSAIGMGPSISRMYSLLLCLSYCMSAGRGGLLMVSLSKKQLAWSWWLCIRAFTSYHHPVSEISSSSKYDQTQSSLLSRQVAAMNSLTSLCRDQMLPRVQNWGQQWMSSSERRLWSIKVKVVRLKSIEVSYAPCHAYRKRRICRWPFLLMNWLYRARGTISLLQHSSKTSSMLHTPRSISAFPSLFFYRLLRNQSKPPRNIVGTAWRYIFFLRGYSGLQGRGSLRRCFQAGSYTIVAMQTRSLLILHRNCREGSHTSS